MSAVERTTGLKSLDEVKAVYGERQNGFFNNFALWFPAAHEGSVEDYRGRIEKDNQLDVPFGAFIPTVEAAFYSSKFLNQTPRQFFKEIDDLALELGTSPEEISELKKLRLEADSPDLKKRYLEQLNELIAPVFFRLREKGYGYFDLT